MMASCIMLAACSPSNEPIPKEWIGQNVLFTSYQETPKHLDPTSSYSNNETPWTYAIYEPPLKYHYLKRPYELLPRTLTALPKLSYISNQGALLAPDAPAKAGCSIADIAAGMYAYTNILSALLMRGKTGQGSHIDVSMLEALGEWMGYPMYYAYQGATPPVRAGASHASIYPYGPFPAGDGGTVMLGLQNEREWKTFCDRV